MAVAGLAISEVPFSTKVANRGASNREATFSAATPFVINGIQTRARPAARFVSKGLRTALGSQQM